MARHCKVPLHAKLPITSPCMQSCPSQRAIVCHVTHRKVLLHAYVAYRKVPSCGMMPITRCNRVQNLLCQVAILWLRCLLRGAMGGYHMVPPYAKFPISWSHRVPMFPMSRCRCLPMFPKSRCHCVPWSPIACPLVVPKVVHRMGRLPCVNRGFPTLLVCVKLSIYHCLCVPWLSI